MKKLLLICILGFACTGRAEGLLGTNNETVHFAAHFVASGLIFSGVYLAMHDGLGAPQDTSFIVGAFTSLLIGFTYKVVEQAGQTSNVNFGKPMLYNAIGVAVPAIVLMSFDL